MKKRISGLAMHCHHNTLFEFVWDFDERVEYLKGNKAEKEQPLRLKLFKIVPDGLLPGKNSREGKACLKAWAAYTKTRAVYTKTWAAWDKAWAACYKTWTAYNKAEAAYCQARIAYGIARVDYRKAREFYFAKYQTELEELHKKLCPDCPWDGHTIFTRKDKNGVWH